MSTFGKTIDTGVAWGPRGAIKAVTRTDTAATKFDPSPIFVTATGTITCITVDGDSLQYTIGSLGPDGTTWIADGRVVFVRVATTGSSIADANIFRAP